MQYEVERSMNGSRRVTRVYLDHFGPTCATYVIFPTSMTDEAIVRECRRMGLPVEGTYCQHEYDCCGRWYHNPLAIERRGQRAMAVSYAAMNV